MSRERLEEIRRMTPEERLRITADMIRAGVRDLLERGPPEFRARRFALLRRENDERTRNMVEGLMRAERQNG